MQIRRPVVSVLAALALFGGTAALTGCCSDVNGLEQRTGTSKDSTENFSGNDPTSVEQGSVYNHGNERPAAAPRTPRAAPGQAGRRPGRGAGSAGVAPGEPELVQPPGRAHQLGRARSISTLVGLSASRVCTSSRAHRSWTGGPAARRAPPGSPARRPATARPWPSPTAARRPAAGTPGRSTAGGGRPTPARAARCGTSRSGAPRRRRCAGGSAGSVHRAGTSSAGMSCTGTCSATTPERYCSAGCQGAGHARCRPSRDPARAVRPARPSVGPCRPRVSRSSRGRRRWPWRTAAVRSSTWRTPPRPSRPAWRRLPLPGDRRPRHRRRRAGRLPRRRPGPGHRPHGPHRLAALERGPAGPDRRPRARAGAGGPAHRLARRPGEHRREDRRRPRSPGRPDPAHRHAGPGLPGLLLRRPRRRRPPAAGPGPVHVAGPQGGRRAAVVLLLPPRRRAGPDPGRLRAGCPWSSAAGRWSTSGSGRRARAQPAGARVDRRRPRRGAPAARPRRRRHPHRSPGHAARRLRRARVLERGCEPAGLAAGPRRCPRTSRARSPTTTPTGSAASWPSPRTRRGGCGASCSPPSPRRCRCSAGCRSPGRCPPTCAADR